MSKDKLTDYDATASNNTDVGGISVAEGMLPSGVNNAIREQMSHQKEAFGLGTPLYVDQTNNRLGIGTTTPSYNLVVSAGGASGIEFGPAYSGTANLVQHYSRSGAAYVDVVNVAAQHKFSIGASEKMRVTTDGITFNGDTAAANALNDYEEGTWTPSVGGNSSNGSTSAHYLKIGDLVHIRFDFTISSIGTGSTSVISGLPFNALGTTGGSIIYYQSLSASPIYLTFYVTTIGTIQFGWNTSGSATIQNNGGAILTSGSRIMGSSTYRYS